MKIPVPALFLAAALMAPLGCQGQDPEIVARAGVLTAQTVPPEDHSEYPDLRLSLKDVIDALSEYDFIHHSDIPAARIGYFGVTDLETVTVHTFQTDPTMVRQTIIHELLHIIARKQGLGPSEDLITVLAPIYYTQIYTDAD